MLRLYLSSLSPWNSTYSTEDGHLLFKVESTPMPNSRKTMLYRALPDLTLPTSERQLWEERHFFETHASTQRSHPELDGQGSGLGSDSLILEESRETHSTSVLESNSSLYEFPLHYTSSGTNGGRRSSPSPSRTMHSETHPFWTKENWVHFADIEYHQVHSSRLNVSGREFAASEFFEKKGWFARTRSFTAWDGHRYTWDLKSREVKLYRSAVISPDTAEKQSEDLLVAEFCGATIVSHHKAGTKAKMSPPTLIVYPEGEAILDLIVVSFVYGELVARDGPSNIHASQVPKSTQVQDELKTEKGEKRLSWGMRKRDSVTPSEPFSLVPSRMPTLAKVF